METPVKTGRVGRYEMVPMPATFHPPPATSNPFDNPDLFSYLPSIYHATLSGNLTIYSSFPESSRTSTYLIFFFASSPG